MTPRSAQAFQSLDRTLLYCASLLLPLHRRAEWLLEWESELWHARRSIMMPRADSWLAQRDLALFCLGAFQDALCLRRILGRNQAPSAPFRGSAAASLAGLAGILFASYFFALILPGVRAAHDFAGSRVRSGTILIQDEASRDYSTPTMAMEQVRIWQRSRQHYFDAFAFYRVTPEPVQLRAHTTATWQIAQASSNLFALMGSPMRSTPPNKEQELPRLILSERAWRREFGADPAIVGKTLRIGTRLVRVVEIAPDRVWKIPGRADAWLLQSEAEINPKGAGYVVAHLTQRGQAEMWDGRVHITSFNSRYSEHNYLGKSLGEQIPGPSGIFLFAAIVALLALPAIAPVSSAEFIFNSHKLSFVRRAMRIGFLGAKIGLILQIAYFVPIDLAYGRLAAFSAGGAYIQVLSCFAICLFGVRWALVDQGRRCPVCLRRVAHPAAVGFVSRTFLDWSGTELMCAGGHTLLHVPALPTSWFSTQRWMFLDPSWDFLFAG
jgi:hypothetical protein